MTKFQKFLIGLEILSKYNSDCTINTWKNDLDEVFECSVLRELDLDDVIYMRRLGWSFEIDHNDAYTKGIYQF